MTRQYEILEHPADLGIKAWGTTLAEAFVNAAQGLFHVILEGESVRPRSERLVSLTASDKEHLLVKWLSELLYLYDAERYVPVGFHLTGFSDTHLVADIRGEEFDPERHHAKLDVKAITYHQLAIEDRPGCHQVTVFVDI